MKWFGAGIIFFSCVLAGIIFYRRSVAQLQFYQQLVAFCHCLEQEISFVLKPLPQIVGAYQVNCGGACRQLLQGYHRLLQSKDDVTREKCLALTSDVLIADFLWQLGRMGCNEERVKIQAARQIFYEKQLQAQQYLQTKASIILKLLIIIGIAGGILWM